jgi:hypothetical protein
VLKVVCEPELVAVVNLLALGLLPQHPDLAARQRLERPTQLLVLCTGGWIVCVNACGTLFCSEGGTRRGLQGSIFVASTRAVLFVVLKAGHGVGG